MDPHPLRDTVPQVLGSDYVGLVPVAGVEPARCRHRRILSFARHTEDDASKEKITELAALEKCRNINALSASPRKKARTARTFAKV